jgi:hypothetical protein
MNTQIRIIWLLMSHGTLTVTGALAKAAAVARSS